MDDLGVQALLLLLGGIPLGALLGWGASFLVGARAGVAVALVLIAGVLSFGGGRLGWATWEEQRGMVAVTGRLLDFKTQTHVQQQGVMTERRTRSVSPRVAYTAADGIERITVGLGGSLAGRQPGDAVTVMVRPDDPTVARIADFQNRWGAVWFFVGIAGVAVLAALVSVGLALQPDVTRAPPRPVLSPWRQRHAARLTQSFKRAGAGTFIAAILFLFSGLVENVARTFAITLAGVATSIVCLGVSNWMEAPGRTLGLLSHVAMAALFAFLAFGLWHLGAR
ncbi:MAG: DUF3592 domain-containing protein [Rubrivivax sp.]|nr:DUF3592 domain-containing protein [Rubrivivax sp.]